MKDNPIRDHGGFKRKIEKFILETIRTKYLADDTEYEYAEQLEANRKKFMLLFKMIIINLLR